LKAYNSSEDTEGELRVSDPTEKDKSVVPLEATDQHSTMTKLECNVGKIATSKPKKNRKSKYGPNKIQASRHAIKRSKRGTLVDQGANGGILGNDAKVIFKHNKTVDVTGIDNHELNSLPMVDATAKTITDKGPVILILRNYVYHGLNRTLHSAGQIEWFRNKVYNTSMKVGGRQVIKTVDGYYLPINIIQGLPYIHMEPNTVKEFDTLPHVILTQGGEWDPTVLDHILTDNDDWVSKVKLADDQEYDFPFDERGEYKHRVPVKAGVQVDNPAGPPNEDPDDIEVNFHAADATMEIHQAYQEVSNLNVVYVYEGEGMPDDEVETVEEEDKTKEDLEANTPLWRPRPNPLTTPSTKDSSYTYQWRRSMFTPKRSNEHKATVAAGPDGRHALSPSMEPPHKMSKPAERLTNGDSNMLGASQEGQPNIHHKGGGHMALLTQDQSPQTQLGMPGTSGGEAAPKC